MNSKKIILSLTFIFSLCFFMTKLGFFSTKKIVIDDTIAINTQSLYFLDSKNTSKNMLSECIFDVFCPKNINLQYNNQFFDIALGYKDIFNNFYLITITKLDADKNLKTLLQNYQKVNECKVKKTNNSNIFNARIMKKNYLIGISANSTNQRNSIVDDFCSSAEDHDKTTLGRWLLWVEDELQLLPGPYSFNNRTYEEVFLYQNIGGKWGKQSSRPPENIRN